MHCDKPDCVYLIMRKKPRFKRADMARAAYTLIRKMWLSEILKFLCLKSPARWQVGAALEDLHTCTAAIRCLAATCQAIKA